MRYIIAHSCGHKSEVELFGNKEERNRQRKQLCNTICADCECREYAEKARSYGLPDLCGSDQQIKAASRIRWLKFIEYAGLSFSNKTARQAVRKGLFMESSAQYWIDTKDKPLIQM